MSKSASPASGAKSPPVTPTKAAPTEPAEPMRTPEERVSKAARAPDSDRSVVRGARLFEAAKQQQAKIAAKREAMPDECTFAPKMMTRRKARRSPPKAAADRLYQAAIKTQEKLDAKREAEEASSTPSFKPQLVARRTKAAKATDSPAGRKEPAFRRLFAEAEVRATKLDEAAGAINSECTFAPTITKKGKAAKGNPKKRLFDATKFKEKAAEREAARESRELEDCTFVPSVCRGPSASAVAAKRRNVYAKLFSDAQALREKNAEASMAQAKAVAEECTFKPAISARSKAVKRPGEAQPLHVRLHAEAKELRQRHAAEAAVAEASARFTFRPAINRSSAAAAATAGRVSPVHERLYEQAKARNATVSRSTPSSDATPMEAWTSMLRTPAASAAAAATNTSSEPAAEVFARLAAHGTEVAERRRNAEDVFDSSKVDWELLLRGEESSIMAPVGANVRPAVVMSPEVAASAARLAKTSLKGHGAAAAHRGPASWTSTLRAAPAPAMANTTRRVVAAV